MKALGLMIMTSLALVLTGCPEWDIAGGRATAEEPQDEATEAAEQELIWYDDGIDDPGEEPGNNNDGYQIWGGFDGRCYTYDKNGNVIEVPCPPGQGAAPGEES
jgi:hypothetical protein